MHLVEAQSAATRLKISRMEIETQTFPLPFVGKYAILITSTGAPAKNYKNWKAVAEWLKLALHANGFYLVQCGGEKDERIGADYDFCGKTGTLQFFDVIKGASLVVCGDTSAVHVAGHFDVPFVALYSISPPSVSKAYFGNPYLQEYIVPESYQPSYNPNENPPALNKITPETVVSKACKLLKIKAPEFKTLYAGSGYGLNVLEIVPNVVLRPEFLPSHLLNIRFDKGGVERAIYDQLAVRKCSVVTSVPLNIEILRQLRGNIESVVYEIDENHSPEFATALMREQIPFRLVSRLSKERLDPIKLSYFDIAIIAQIDAPANNESLAGKKFKTGRRIFSDGKIYLSHAHVKIDKSVDSFDKSEDTVVDAPEFWEDKELYYIYE